MQAGKAEAAIHAERSAITSAEKRLLSLATECGAVAVSSGISFEDEPARAACREGSELLGQIGGEREKKKTLSEDLAKIDAKAEPAKCQEIKSEIASISATIKQATERLGAIHGELGKQILASSVPDPRLSDFYRRQVEINDRIKLAETHIAQLKEQRDAVEKSLELLKMPLVTIDGFGQCIASKRHGGRYGQVVGARRTVGIG